MVAKRQYISNTEGEGIQGSHIRKSPSRVYISPQERPSVRRLNLTDTTLTILFMNRTFSSTVGAMDCRGQENHIHLVRVQDEGRVGDAQ